MEKIYLKQEYDFIMNKIKSRENFMLLRYGDGERSIMRRKRVIAQEGWVSPNEKTKLGVDLVRSLSLMQDNVYYGISCPCCDRDAYYWYSSRIKNKNITFANIFVNGNYSRFIKDFSEITRDAIVIGNSIGKDNRIGNLNVLKYYSVGDQCQEFWDNNSEELIKEIISEYGKKDNLLYVVSAGPMAEPILYSLYKNNPNNCYIDFGSSIDCYIHKKDTRPYTNPMSTFGSRNCWMFDSKNTDFGVSVLLTTYKKPDALEKQLKAIRNQSLLPKEILLYQDGINEQYDIRFNKELLDKFKVVCINDKNQGVWKRFEFAKNNCSQKYVCVFDDDTIPGRRWLENCHYHMVHNEGVYGTVGIVIKNYKEYPYKGFERIGWHNPYSKLTQVDFVGHSWFIKREYLDFMFEETEKYQKYKLAAEDMCLSYKCKQHGINTYVPPHPIDNYSLWGSQPELGLRFGNSSVAISQNVDNCMNMRSAIEDFVSDGWEFVFDRSRTKTKAALYGAKIEQNKRILRKGISLLRSVLVKFIGEH